MDIMFKFENAEYNDEQVLREYLETVPDITFETASEEGIDAVSILLVVITSGTLTALITAAAKVYSTKIKSINEKKYSVKITKDGIEVNAPTLNETRKLLRDASFYREQLGLGDNDN